MFTHFVQGQTKIVHPSPIGSPRPPGWWVKVFLGGLVRVNYNGPDFLEVSKTEVHKDYGLEYSEDISWH